jgi:hypothetical protein
MQRLKRGRKYFSCLPVTEDYRAGKHIVSQEGEQYVFVISAWRSTSYWIVLEKDAW